MARQWDDARRRTLVLTIDGIDEAVDGREILALDGPARILSAKVLATSAVAIDDTDFYSLDLVVDGEVVGSATHETVAFSATVPQNLTLVAGSDRIEIDQAVQLALSVGGGTPPDITGTTFTVTLALEQF